MPSIEKLGPYRITDVLGRGGMGTVYAGVHEETGEKAAIKMLSVAVNDDRNLRQRFLSEIETLKQLRHPNIVQLYGDGEQDGYLFYVMELVEGTTLQQDLQQGHEFDWEEVTDIAVEVCRALKHAHDRGIIHRDLKPANLMRTREGVLKLTDFGIAKLFGITHLTADGSVVGTADYMAPEQAEGRPVTNRTDLYSLGSVMFALLARRPPFTGSALPQIIHQLRYDDAPRVRQYAPSVPRELDDIIAQLLEKSPEKRIPTALALANRLQAMKHALSLGVADDLPTSADLDDQTPDDRGIPVEGPTRMVEPELGMPTEVQPTTVDKGSDDKDAKAWGDPTQVSHAGERSSDDSPLSSADTVAETTERASRFTLLEEAERQLDAAARREQSESARSHWQAAGWGLALLALIAAIAYGVWPPSADRLYSRIIQKSEADGPEAARREIEQFLERFPNDARYEEVHDLFMDVESDWLQSRLALKELKSGGSLLEPYERDYLDAMRLKRKDPQAALARFQSLVESYGAAEQPAPALQSCLDAAKHQIKRLDE